MNDKCNTCLHSVCPHLTYDHDRIQKAIDIIETLNDYGFDPVMKAEKVDGKYIYTVDFECSEREAILLWEFINFE